MSEPARPFSTTARNAPGRRTTSARVRREVTLRRPTGEGGREAPIPLEPYAGQVRRCLGAAGRAAARSKRINALMSCPQVRAQFGGRPIAPERPAVLV